MIEGRLHRPSPSYIAAQSTVVLITGCHHERSPVKHLRHGELRPLPHHGRSPTTGG